MYFHEVYLDIELQCQCIVNHKILMKMKIMSSASIFFLGGLISGAFLFLFLQMSFLG